MTDTSIRAELRMAAMAEDPWEDLRDLFYILPQAFCQKEQREHVHKLSDDHVRWFFLLVAEAL